MKIKLVPEKNFDIISKKTIQELVNIAERILKELEINLPKKIEFYDEFYLFYKRILFQVKKYGLTKKQSINFIKASLNLGTYGTFDIKENSIIEMNFNPHFKKFYPSIHFLKLLVHESLHLFLYSKLDYNIYSDKFKFQNKKYMGKKEVIQLDEGFAKFLTNKILESFNFDSIKEWPIYSGANKTPEYSKKVDGLDIDKFNKFFNKIYKDNSNKGYKIIENKFNKLREDNLKEKIKKLIRFVQKKIDKLYEHK